MNKLNPPIRWGIVGCGDVTEKKSGPAFYQIANSQLAAVMRRDAAKAEDYARRHGVARWTTDASEIIESPDIDAVYIATPPGSHREYALQVAAAGKPCYVEKPMARNASECRDMIEAFQEAGQPLFVAYYRRGLPRFLEAKRVIEAGRIGEFTTVLYRFANSGSQKLQSGDLPWRLEAEHSGGGRFLDLASHTLDILDYILGPLLQPVGRAWRSKAAPHSTEDVVHLQFSTTSGALGSAAWNFASDQREDLIEFCGTEGKLSLSCFGDEPLCLTRSNQTEEIARPNPATIQQPLVQSIVDELLGNGSCPSTGHTALRTSQLMDDVLDAFYGGRQDDFWTRPHSWPGAQAPRRQ